MCKGDTTGRGPLEAAIVYTVRRTSGLSDIFVLGRRNAFYSGLGVAAVDFDTRENLEHEIDHPFHEKEEYC